MLDITFFCDVHKHQCTLENKYLLIILATVSYISLSSHLDKYLPFPYCQCPNGCQYFFWAITAHCIWGQHTSWVYPHIFSDSFWKFIFSVIHNIVHMFHEFICQIIASEQWWNKIHSSLQVNQFDSCWIYYFYSALNITFCVFP